MNFDDKKKEYIQEAQKVREKTKKIITDANEEQLKKKMSEHNESWTVLEVAKHIYTSEDGMVKLMKQIKDHSDPNTLPGVPEDFDLDRYNKRQVQKLQELTKEDILTKLSESRANFVTFVENLTEKDLPKKGRHASLRVLSIEEILQLISSHETEHQNKLMNALN